MKKSISTLIGYWNLPPEPPSLQIQNYDANASGGKEAPEVFCYICGSKIRENNKGAIIV